jgi:hypothetical protein
VSVPGPPIFFATPVSYIQILLQTIRRIVCHNKFSLRPAFKMNPYLPELWNGCHTGHQKNEVSAGKNGDGPAAYLMRVVVPF